MNDKNLKSFKKGTGGRKKGVPNKITREIKDVFERLVGFISDKDLWDMYKKFKRKPELFLKILQMIYPKDFNIKFNGLLNTTIDNPFDGISNELKEKMLKMIEQEKNDKINE